MLSALTTVLAAEGAEGGINPYAVAGGVLLLLLFLLVALVSFGGGREHS